MTIERDKPRGEQPRRTYVKDWINIPFDLHPISRDLIRHFAEALADKMLDAEIKYGFEDTWRTDEWEAECQEHLLEHITKGDPRDVAIYCAFLWFHKWRTAPEKGHQLMRLFLEALVIGDPLALSDIRGNALVALGRAEGGAWSGTGEAWRKTVRNSPPDPEDCA